MLEEQLKKEAESKVLVLEECQMLKARESSLKHPAVAMEQLHEVFFTKELICKSN